jgi:hypothetical protein
MINIHLNGDIVRCPDIKLIKLRSQELKDKKRICKYNYHEDNCSTWQSSLTNWQSVKKNNCAGRCILSGTLVCPGHIRQIDIGKKEKTFKINNQIYRKLASTGHYLVKESENKVLFLTLTFPKFKKKISDNEINKYFSKYVENLRKNYHCGGYIAVREFGKKLNRVHFHLLLSIPFIPFTVLNASWINCIKNICHYSANALTSDPKTRFIHDPIRAMKYVCKYFAKTKGQFSKSRLVFVSNNIIQKPKSYYGNVRDFLTGYESIHFNQTSDYTTLFRITDSKEFNRFCNEFLYPLFELSIKKSEYLYSFPINSS